MAVDPGHDYLNFRLGCLIEDLSKFSCYQEVERLSGPIEFSIGECKFDAYCDLFTNRVVLSTHLFKEDLPPSIALQSALFEVANLSQKVKFQDLVGRVKLLTPDEFVEEYERIEHQSALICKTVLRKIFPKEKWSECSLAYTSENFHVHYMMQQITGHSKNIYKAFRSEFDPFLKYKGSFSYSIRKKDVDILKKYIDMVVVMLDAEHPLSKEASQVYNKFHSPQNENQRKHYSDRLLRQLDEIDFSIEIINNSRDGSSSL